MAYVVCELEVRLRNVAPPVWRRLEVPGNFTLNEVHFAIQAAMGWTHSHLHQFMIGDKVYGLPNLDSNSGLALDDERHVKLQDVVGNGASFTYEYDFGDGWEHDVTVKRLEPTTAAPRPLCTAGGGACPPENCGGPPGYSELVASGAVSLRAKRFSLPPTGLELRPEMERLRNSVGEGHPSGYYVDTAADDADLPGALVEAVLALRPDARALLGAIIARSLAPGPDPSPRKPRHGPTMRLRRPRS